MHAARGIREGLAPAAALPIHLVIRSSHGIDEVQVAGEEPHQRVDGELGHVFLPFRPGLFHRLQRLLQPALVHMRRGLQAPAKVAPLRQPHQRDPSDDQGTPAPAGLGASTILSDTTLELTCDAYTKAEADSRFQAVGDTAALDARYFPINSFTEGGPIYNLIQDKFTPRRIRSLVPRAPVSLLPILGNGSALELEVDCWSKSESDSRYVLTATFNGLGTQVTALDGRVAALEASPLPADISCTSLTAFRFVETSSATQSC